MLDNRTTTSRPNLSPTQQPSRAPELSARSAHPPEYGPKRGGTGKYQWVTDWWMPPPACEDLTDMIGTDQQHTETQAGMNGAGPTGDDAPRACKGVATEVADRPTTIVNGRASTVLDPTIGVERYRRDIGRRGMSAAVQDLAYSLRGGLDHPSPIPLFRLPPNRSKPDKVSPMRDHCSRFICPMGSLPSVQETMS